MKSESHNLFGAGTLNCRFTLSIRQGGFMSGRVAVCGVPRLTLRIPMAFISLPTMQRAISKTSRRNCRQTLCALRRPASLHQRRAGCADEAPHPVCHDPTAATGPPLRQMFVIGGRCDRQNVADWLNPVVVPVTVDDGDHVLCRRSSSGIARKMRWPCAGYHWPSAVRAFQCLHLLGHLAPLI